MSRIRRTYRRNSPEAAARSRAVYEPAAITA